VLASINDFQLADGTMAGGVALSQVNFEVQRIFDVVVALGELNPVLFDRGVRRTIIDFQVARIHASLEAADLYVIEHDALIPSSGLVQFTATNGSKRNLLNATLFTHQRIGIFGKATLHSYHIEGGHFVPAAFHILTETTGYVLQETGDRIEME
jgi:hypothetical protein